MLGAGVVPDRFIEVERGTEYTVCEKQKKSSAMMKDMTVGNPIRLILSFAAPLFTGNIFQQIYTMVDTMEMGYFVGDDAISAIGAASSLYNLLERRRVSQGGIYDGGFYDSLDAGFSPAGTDMRFSAAVQKSDSGIFSGRTYSAGAVVCRLC